MKNENKDELIKKDENIDKSRRNLLIGAAAIAGTGIVANSSLAASPAFPSSRREERIKRLCEKFNKPFKGKTAFITGGARGIGRGCAEILAKDGANIVLYDVAGQIETVKYPLATYDDLEETKLAIEAYGVQCLAIKGDVRSRDQLNNAMQETIDTFGSLDFLIANAGITQVGMLETFSDEEVNTVIDVNLGGVIKTIQAATPHLQAQKSGRIIVTSSVTGRGGSAQFPVYSATKWGVIGLTKATAQALGPFNVTCNAICPDIVNTKLLDNDYILGAFGVPDFETFSNMVREMHPLPIGAYEPIDVGKTVRYLCSEDAAYISADVFDIAGGANSSHMA